ncbi:hypothetical protein [Amycolatopsis sp. NPDC004625]|uniref:hypothetical protein n=1 Tax=Amycolatopsis sp. NPDC004625 TaxID=3154670 RepID=UPI0033BECAAD
MTDEQQPAPAVEKYLGAASLAKRLGVSRSAVNKWRERYPQGSAHPFPAPDIDTDGAPGWHPLRLPEIEAWRTGMPGSGNRLDSVEEFAARITEVTDDFEAAKTAERLVFIAEHRRPGDHFAFGYLKTNPRSSRGVHDGYVAQLVAAGCEVVRGERVAGDELTDGFLDLIDNLKPGDVFMVPRAYQLSRSRDLALKAVALVESRGARVEYLYGVGPIGTA